VRRGAFQESRPQYVRNSTPRQTKITASQQYSRSAEGPAWYSVGRAPVAAVGLYFEHYTPAPAVPGPPLGKSRLQRRLANPQSSIAWVGGVALDFALVAQAKKKRKAKQIKTQLREKDDRQSSACQAPWKSTRLLHVGTIAAEYERRGQ
jgi:hypothetical protein